MSSLSDNGTARPQHPPNVAGHLINWVPKKKIQSERTLSLAFVGHGGRGVTIRNRKKNTAHKRFAQNSFHRIGHPFRYPPFSGPGGGWSWCGRLLLQTGGDAGHTRDVTSTNPHILALFPSAVHRRSVSPVRNVGPGEGDRHVRKRRSGMTQRWPLPFGNEMQ